MRESLRVLASMAEHEKKAIYIVGGFVRDMLRGLESRDVDMVVSEEAEQFAKRAAWRLRGNYELLDSHSQYSRIKLTASDGKPLTFDISLLQGNGITADLSRRDFTVNALAVKLSNYLSDEAWARKIVDPCGGVLDLHDKVLRLTSERCLTEDPVRLFRAARFSLKLGFTVAAESKLLLQKNAGLVRNAQKMKLALELFQLLVQPYAAEGLRILQEEFACLTPFFPPFYRMSVMKNNGETLLKHGLSTCQKLDEFCASQAEQDELKKKISTHLQQPLSEYRPKITYLRLACLLHDVGKVDGEPCGTTLPPSFNHEIAGEQYISSLAKRLYLSEEEEQYLIRLVCNHSRPGFLIQSGLGSRFRYFRQFQEMAPDLLLLAMANTAAHGNITASESMADFLRHYFQGSYKSLPQPLVSAQDIMSFFNLPPVRTVGGLLEEVYAAQLDGSVTSKSEAMALVSRLLDK